MQSVVLNMKRKFINIHKFLCTNTDIFIEETDNILTRGLETGVHHGRTPSLIRVKEEQEKAINFCR